MKKLILHTALLAATVCFAQPLMSQVEFGAKAGVNLSDITTDGLNFGSEFLEPEMIANPSAGLYVTIPLGNGFSFTPEVNYTQKGFKVSESTSFDLFGLPIPVGAEAVTRLHYIDMPLMLKYSMGQGSVRPYLKAGPTVGYAISGSVTTRINSIIDIKVAEIDIDPQGDLYNAFEIGAIAGAGFEVPTAHGKFFAEATFSHGFTDVLDEPVVDVRVYNRGFGVGIGYALRF